MNFNPRMESRIDGFRVVQDLRWRVWNGVVADLWDVACDECAEGHYLSPDPRLFVLLEMEGAGHFEVGHSDSHAVHNEPVAMSFIPAGYPLVAQASGLRRILHLDLHFSENAVRQRFGRAFDPRLLTQARLSLADDRIAGLARLIADECANNQPFHGKYGEGLVDALLTLLLDVRVDRARRRAELSRRQLGQATSFIEAHCFESIRLADLAATIGLSQTHFSHAFKASTGMPPHRWQMHSRIRKAQAILRTGEVPLIEIANATGFSDQAHFTRVFKSIVGLTPSEWRRQNAS